MIVGEHAVGFQHGTMLALEGHLAARQERRQGEPRVVVDPPLVAVNVREFASAPLVLEDPPVRPNT